MLESSRRLTMPAGSNLRDLTDTSWFHLLASLELGTVVCFGSPPPTVRRLLETHAETLVVIDPDGQHQPSIPTCELIVLARRDATTIEIARSVLGPKAATADIVVLDPGTNRTRRGIEPAHRLVDRLDSIGASGRRWVLLRARRQSHRLVRRFNRVAQLVVARFEHLIGRLSTVARRHASDLTVYRPIPVDKKISRQRGTLLGSAAPSMLPEYLRSVATRHGLDLNAEAWGYGPARGFRSQKIVFTAVDTTTGSEVIIKATQESRFNDRLNAEAAALEFIGRAGIDTTLAVPTLLFADEHAGLSLVAEQMLEGPPMRRVAGASPDDPHWSMVVEGLVDIATATSRRAPRGEVQLAVETLIADHRSIYSAPTHVTKGLTAIAERLGQFSLPTVLQHGDLGVWNLVSTSQGAKVGALDWENADSAGMPLWDLFVFARTFGIFMADSAGSRYGPSIFARQLLSPGVLHSALATATRRYCTALEIPIEAAGDLFSLCWAQQAVREAATLEDSSWANARNNRYLESSLLQPLDLR